MFNRFRSISFVESWKSRVKEKKTSEQNWIVRDRNKKKKLFTEIGSRVSIRNCFPVFRTSSSCFSPRSYYYVNLLSSMFSNPDGGDGHFSAHKTDGNYVRYSSYCDRQVAPSDRVNYKWPKDVVRWIMYYCYTTIVIIVVMDSRKHWNPFKTVTL